MKVEIYTKGYCPYCRAAKKLLKQLNWEYKEFEITNRPALQKEMKLRSRRHTVPQIFINNQHIGGFDDFSVFLSNKVS
ncbi:glutaredoxin 3 [Neptuniibacter caesariensis]|uniref:Glutaredoxin n=1 Tax=Neptuniibacter caesariensis TaxID=207954 RepID=A0A7U8GTH0_NEPCE|nr:glutaredoxin 3 [Neptuniibacter caesariensis]EAR62426.1 glutaredoxin 3 (Grx3) [Oceanospirillum sp. MED92] [Neptuniibacter caesariensis]